MTSPLAQPNPADQRELERILLEREDELNRQLVATFTGGAIIFFCVWLCTMTGVFLTGRPVGTAAFLGGSVVMASAAVYAAHKARKKACDPWTKHVLLTAMAVAIILIALVQVVWSVPCLVGMATYVYAYNNLRVIRSFHLILPFILLACAGINAIFGMPNPDMLPYPCDVHAVKDGYITLWAMAHPDQWDHLQYFGRVLRFHSLPLAFLMVIVGYMGSAMVRRHNSNVLRVLQRERRLREIGDALTSLALGAVPPKLTSVFHMPPLDPKFVATISAQDIPRLMRTLRTRSRQDRSFADLLARDPEAAIKTCQMQ